MWHEAMDFEQQLSLYLALKILRGLTIQTIVLSYPLACLCFTLALLFCLSFYAFRFLLLYCIFVLIT